MITYLTIGLIYWAVNSFVRKIETNGDWLLPVVWFLAWPLAFAAWALILLNYMYQWAKTKNLRKHF